MCRAFRFEHHASSRGPWSDAHNTLSELVNGKRGISPEMAVRLSKVFGGAEQGWLVQQAQYDLAQVARERIKLKRLKLV